MCHNAITHNTDSAVGQSTLDPRSAHVCRSCVSWLKLTNVSYTLPVDTGHTMTVSSTGQRQKDDLWDLQRKHIPFQAALSYSYKVASAPAEIWVFEEFVVVFECFCVILSCGESGTQGSRIPYGKPVVFQNPVERRTDGYRYFYDLHVDWMFYSILLELIYRWKGRNEQGNIVFISYLLFSAPLLSL